jgi:hypothetical protein
LISAGTRIVAYAAFALNEAVSEEFRVRGTERLRGFSLFDETVFPEATKDLLDNFRLLRSWSPPEDVKVDFKPIVDVFVNGMIFSTQSSRIYPFLKCLGFRGGAVFVLVILVSCTQLGSEI